ncbi:hypothetical protein [Mycobacteroides abscessus]|uniref:hypothetical protein n=1 Tax=Mycobacteroides abscessus TaxID=36809 RepID=UPI00104266A2|nr:hypothetical protein [Mycobacteroides abscessus]
MSGWSMLLPGVALATVSVEQLREFAHQYGDDGDVFAAAGIHAAAVAAEQVQRAKENETGPALTNTRIRAALAVMTGLGYRGDDLDLVRRLVDDWVGLELTGVEHDMIGEQLYTTAEEDGDSSLLFVLEEVWPDIVMESAAIAARWNRQPGE